MPARIQLPNQVKRGELIEVRVLIQHPMETGYQRDEMGRAVPRNVIRSISCKYNGIEVFSAELSSGIAANPYLQFYTRANAAGEMELTWVDDANERGSERTNVNVVDA